MSNNVTDKFTRKESLRQAKRDSRIFSPKNDAKEKKEDSSKQMNGQYTEGEIILGTIPGYAPARIQEMIKDTIYIEFFGSGEVYVFEFSIIIQNIVQRPDIFIFSQKLSAFKSNSTIRYK